MSKNFEELGYASGDLVKCVSSRHSNFYKAGDIFELYKNQSKNLWGRNVSNSGCTGVFSGVCGVWALVVDKPLPFGDMTPNQQGALLLAYHQGKSIELLSHNEIDWIKLKHAPWWASLNCYRVKTSPDVLSHVSFLSQQGDRFLSLCLSKLSDSTHELEYNTIDGVVDCSSVKLRVTK